MIPVFIWEVSHSQDFSFTFGFPFQEELEHLSIQFLGWMLLDREGKQSLLALVYT